VFYTECEQADNLILI